ncbi:hypothetical protein Ddye_025320 [Dipteronia dyeriana]|uniref:Uncharacterized protein n=1 Tax=Dipteronia dyeriana TaxID=168575 RepID=A0AAD9TWZ3_9ROSI|nr:hypothetical protein Ddye_025320 [Dipteronia dyeriana]
MEDIEDMGWSKENIDGFELAAQFSPVNRGRRNNRIKVQEAGKLWWEVLQRFRVGQKWHQQQLQLLEDPLPLLLVLFSKQQPEESPRSRSPTIPFTQISLSAVRPDHSPHLFLPGCFDENWPLLFLSTPPFQLLVLSPSSPAKPVPLIKGGIHTFRGSEMKLLITTSSLKLF